MWGHQDSVESLPARLVNRFELLGTDPAETTAALLFDRRRNRCSRPRRRSPAPSVADQFLDRSVLRLLKNDSAAALSWELRIDREAFQGSIFARETRIQPQSD